MRTAASRAAAAAALAATLAAAAPAAAVAPSEMAALARPPTLKVFELAR
jgi:hypothetical protein